CKIALRDLWRRRKNVPMQPFQLGESSGNAIVGSRGSGGEQSEHGSRMQRVGLARGLNLRLGHGRVGHAGAPSEGLSEGFISQLTPCLHNVAKTRSCCLCERLASNSMVWCPPSADTCKSFSGTRICEKILCASVNMSATVLVSTRKCMPRALRSSQI